MNLRGDFDGNLWKKMEQKGGKWFLLGGMNVECSG